METNFINIEDGLFERQLLKTLYQKQFEIEFDKQLLNLLQKLCRAELNNESNLSIALALNNEEKEMILNLNIVETCRNKEIVARWCDCKQEFDKSNRPLLLKTCSDNYLEIYKSTKRPEYLVRRLQIIRKAKSLFTNDLEEILDFTKKVIINSVAPFWQNQIMMELCAIVGLDKCEQNFSDFFEKQMEKFNNEEKFIEARFCLDSLYHIGKITLNQFHFKKAESFEKEGDCIDAKRESNTFYPTLSEKYLNGLKEIHSLGDCEILKQRLIKKVAKAQKENLKMIQSYGIKMNSPVDFEKVNHSIFELKIENFKSGFKELISLPIVTENVINNYVDIEKSISSPLIELFSENVKIDGNGAKIARATEGEAYISNAREFVRHNCIAHIIGLKNVIDIYQQSDLQHIFDSLKQCKSKFIPEDRISIYAMAINEGFRNRFITAVHLLIPQIENSFRYIANQNGIETINWAADLQYQKIFGGILEKIKNFTNSDLHKELCNFFIDQNSNFRNNLCHGLLQSSEIEYYGYYVWWLSLKMIFQTESYFSFIDT